MQLLPPFRASEQVSLSVSPSGRICGYKAMSTDTCKVEIHMLISDVIAIILKIAKSQKTAQGTSLERYIGSSR